MTRSYDVALPDPAVFGTRLDRSIRLLAVADEPDPALDDERNREALGPIDMVLGCGDLEPDYLAFLADAFSVPLVYVRGNHDRGANWEATSGHAPAALDNGELVAIGRLSVAGLGWPGPPGGLAQRDELSALFDVLRLGRRWLSRRLRRRAVPAIVVSHVPPRDVGDCASDAYHRGFRAYRWLLDLARPPLWIHGHVTPASVTELVVRHAGTTVVNATGSVLIELRPPSGTSAG